MILELEADGTYEAERKACRIINYDWMNPNEIYYYKVSPIDKELVWIYKSPVSAHWILGCHISRLDQWNLERIERCSFRKNDECECVRSHKMCPVYKGDMNDLIMNLVNVSKE